MDNITAKLAFFPLGMTVLPGEVVNLHIFEPRYIQLIQDCNSEELSFGIPFIKGSQISEYGTQVKLKKVLRVYKNGTMDILVQGTGIFKILNFVSALPNKLYSGGEIQFIKRDSVIRNLELISSLRKYNAVAEEVKNPGHFLGPVTIYDVANAIALTDRQKYKLMTIEDVEEQESFLLNIMDYLVLLHRQERSAEDQLYLN